MDHIFLSLFLDKLFENFPNVRPPICTVYESGLPAVYLIYLIPLGFHLSCKKKSSVRNWHGNFMIRYVSFFLLFFIFISSVTLNLWNLYPGAIFLELFFCPLRLFSFYHTAENSVCQMCPIARFL